ncbi:unnamed protein product [Linum trigynum]|uniref:Lon N-terminal domain-containing protein n=2 Tax=Linum trigynum TaxID=586398 RepID=A0AAV2GGZ9_9ROSI
MGYGASSVNPSSLSGFIEPRIRRRRPLHFSAQPTQRCGCRSSDSTVMYSSRHYSFRPFDFQRTYLRRQRTPKWRCRSSLKFSSLELPLLPFNSNEVLVPSESKTLHLYEARYLALLEEALVQKKMFVHFVLDPISISDSGGEASFAARYGCLVNIESVERLDVGALVSVRGIGRVKLAGFLQSEPYLRGEVKPVQDIGVDSANEISSKVTQVKEALGNLNSLEIKLKPRKDELLQTRLANALWWAEKELELDCDEAFVPSLAERISFAALQPISGSSQSELYNLQQEKLRAMDMRDTLKRLDGSLKLISQNISMVAAKLAIQSLGMS